MSNIKTLIEYLFQVKILTEDEYVSMFMEKQVARDKLYSIKKAYNMLSNPLVINAKERLIELIESI